MTKNPPEITLTDRRGWVDIYPSATGFQVYDWTEHHDSGALVGDFATRREALAFAVNWSVTHGRKLQTAEVYHFPVRPKGGAQ